MTIPVVNDEIPEESERFNITIYQTDPAVTIGFPNTAVIMIFDDDDDSKLSDIIIQQVSYCYLSLRLQLSI